MAFKSQVSSVLRRTGAPATSASKAALRATRTARMSAPLASSAAPTSASTSRCFSTSPAQSIRQTQPRNSAIVRTSERYPSLKRDERFGKLTPEHVTFFKELLGENAVIDAVTNPAAQDDVEGYNGDWMRKYRGHGQLVLRPGSTEEVSKALKYCNEHNLAVVPQGGNTGLVGGSVPVFDEIVLSLNRMQGIRSFDETSGTLVVDAGVVLEAADMYLAERGYLFPLDRKSVV